MSDPDPDIVTGEIVPAAVHSTLADTWRRPQAQEKPLSAGARELVLGGIPTSTRDTYRRAWNHYVDWADAQQPREEILPSAESTMIEYLNSWRSLPVHNRCAGGRQTTGEPCTGHRPAPATMWIWYSAVRMVHSLTFPPYPWHGGKRLALAMKRYSEEMVLDLGWVPNKAPRAWPEHVIAMIDALDLDDPKDVRDKALILTCWRTAARASDLCTYRIGDVTFTPLGADLTLRASKTNRAVGRVVERRVLRPNTTQPQYCPVEAMRAWVQLLAREYNVTQGALFRPFSKPSLKTGIPTLLRGHRDDLSYRMDGMSASRVVSLCAVRAGVPDGEHFTCHSLRRGRASQLRELGVDSLAIARAHGWVPGGAVTEYLEEADAFDNTAPAAMVGPLGL